MQPVVTSQQANNEAIKPQSLVNPMLVSSAPGQQAPINLAHLILQAWLLAQKQKQHEQTNFARPSIQAHTQKLQPHHATQG